MDLRQLAATGISTAALALLPVSTISASDCEPPPLGMPGGEGPDCNQNGVPDSCDLATGSFAFLAPEPSVYSPTIVGPGLRRHSWKGVSQRLWSWRISTETPLLTLLLPTTLATNDHYQHRDNPNRPASSGIGGRLPPE